MGELLFHCTVINIYLADTVLSLVNMRSLSWECRVAFSKELVPSDGIEMHSPTQSPCQKNLDLQGKRYFSFWFMQYLSYPMCFHVYNLGSLFLLCSCSLRERNNCKQVLSQWGSASTFPNVCKSRFLQCLGHDGLNLNYTWVKFLIVQAIALRSWAH